MSYGLNAGPPALPDRTLLDSLNELVECGSKVYKFKAMIAQLTPAEFRKLAVKSGAALFIGGLVLLAVKS